MKSAKQSTAGRPARISRDDAAEAALAIGLDKVTLAGIIAFSKACRRLEAFGFKAAEAVLVMDSIMDMTINSSSGWQRMTTI